MMHITLVCQVFNTKCISCLNMVYNEFHKIYNLQVLRTQPCNTSHNAKSDLYDLAGARTAVLDLSTCTG